MKINGPFLGEEISFEIKLSMNLLQIVIMLKEIENVKIITQLAKQQNGGEKLRSILTEVVKSDDNRNLHPDLEWILDCNAVHLAAR